MNVKMDKQNVQREQDVETQEQDMFVFAQNDKDCLSIL